MGELLPRVRALALLATQLRHRPEHRRRRSRPPRTLARPARALCFDPELAGWNGFGFVVQAYQKRCPFVIDYLVDLARRSRSPLMVRLVKGAYWDSEIKRAQVDGLAGYPVFTRKVYTDVSYLACAKKLLGGARRDLSAVRHAQRAHAVGDLSPRGPELLARPVRIPAPARHGRGAVRRRSSARDKLNRPCRVYAPVGTHETCCLPRAPPARKRREHVVRQPHRRRRPFRSTIWSPIRSTKRRAHGAARRAASAHSAAARSVRRERAQLAWASIWRTSIALARCRRRCSRARTRRGRASRRCSATTTAAAARRATCATRPTSATSSARCVEADADDVERALSARRRRRADLGRRLPADERARCLERAADLLEAQHADADRLWSCAKPARRCRTRSPKCARRSTSCATTRRRCAREFGERHASCRSGPSSASARGISRWRSSPARSPRRSPPATRCSPSPPSRRR